MHLNLISSDVGTEIHFSLVIYLHKRVSKHCFLSSLYKHLVIGGFEVMASLHEDLEGFSTLLHKVFGICMYCNYNFRY